MFGVRLSVKKLETFIDQIAFLLVSIFWIGGYFMFISYSLYPSIFPILRIIIAIDLLLYLLLAVMIAVTKTIISRAVGGDQQNSTSCTLPVKSEKIE